MCHRFKDDGQVCQPEDKPAGRPRKLDNPEERAQLRAFLDRHPDAFIREATDYLCFECGIDVDTSTVYRVMAKYGWIKKKTPTRDRNTLGLWKRSVPQDENGNSLYGPIKNFGKIKTKSKDLNGRTKKQTEMDEKVFRRVNNFVRKFMSHPRFDASHDYAHVMRVVNLSKHILKMERLTNPSIQYDHLVVHLGALMHDIDDHKYSIPETPTPAYPIGQNPGLNTEPSMFPTTAPTHPPYGHEAPAHHVLNTSSQNTPKPVPETNLDQNTHTDSDKDGDTRVDGHPLENGSKDQASTDLSTQPPAFSDPHSASIHTHLSRNRVPKRVIPAICAICKATSYTFEISNPETATATLAAHPELGIIQDADRLDALGAIGLARAFTYGGARVIHRGLEGTMAHLDEKLLKLEGMMKTQEGKRLAKVRTERLKMFQDWWEEETQLGNRVEDYMQHARPDPVRMAMWRATYGLLYGNTMANGQRADVGDGDGDRDGDRNGAVHGDDAGDANSSSEGEMQDAVESPALQTGPDEVEETIDQPERQLMWEARVMR